MKTYHVTLNDDTAALVDKMMQDGPWESIDALFADGIGTLQEDILLESELNFDCSEVRQKLTDAGNRANSADLSTEVQVLSYLMARLRRNRQTVSVDPS